MSAGAPVTASALASKGAAMTVPSIVPNTSWPDGVTAAGDDPSTSVVTSPVASLRA